MIGKVLDKYEILQKVGEGGMAVVYRGRHVTLGRDVAVKVLHPHLSSSTRNRQRFAREARAIEQLDHPNILRIFDYSGSDSQEAYIVTEFIDGVTLSEFIRERRRLPSEAVAILGLGLASALEYAHSEGIIHRDLKPENVMIRRDGVLKLMDFGIARFLEEGQMTMTGALVGSPAYMNPEQAMEHRLDRRSDLFSLGTVLFHAVSGELPFTGSNPSVIPRNIIEGNRPDVAEVAPDTSPPLADVIERLLQTSIENRFQSAVEVRGALEECLQSVGIDPEEERWSLRRLSLEPEAYRQELEAHLGRALLERGRGLLEAGQHLDALRTFNRLLALDPDNEEVLALVQSLHTGPHTSPARKVSFAGLAVLVAALGLLAFWLVGPDLGSADHPEPPVPVVAPGPGGLAAAVPVPGQPGEPGGGPGAGVGQPVEPGQPGAQPASATAAGQDVTSPRVTGTSPDPPGASVDPGGHSGEVIRAHFRDPREPLAVPPRPPPEAPGSIRVILEWPGWADVWIDGEAVGRANEKVAPEVAPGKHRVVLRNSLCKDWEQDIIVAAGEQKVVSDVRMSPLPATVNIAQSVGDSCVVGLDGTILGTAGGIGRQFSLPDPSVAHELVLRCPEADPQTYTIESTQAGASLVVPGLP
ncbi:MAG: protein kinase [Pseudomonadota bacterium]